MSPIYRESKENNGIKEGRNTIISKGKLQLLQHIQSHQTPEQKNKMSNIWMYKFRIVRKRPNECVRKKEGARAYKQCVHEMITNTEKEDMNKILIKRE